MTPSYSHVQVVRVSPDHGCKRRGEGTQVPRIFDREIGRLDQQHVTFLQVGGTFDPAQIPTIRLGWEGICWYGSTQRRKHYSFSRTAPKSVMLCRVAMRSIMTRHIGARYRVLGSHPICRKSFSVLQECESAAKGSSDEDRNIPSFWRITPFRIL